MKTEIGIILVGFFLILGISFFIFNIHNSGITGFAVDSSGNTTNEKANESIIITEEMAMQTISESEQVIQDMQENNFSVIYMQDSLTEAKKIFEQARYAEILRNVNSTEKEKQEARVALSSVKWQNITYADVLFYTEDIKNRKTIAFFLFDKINVEESKVIGASNETKAIFEQAKIAFSEERYDDAEKLLNDFDVAVEKEKSESSALVGISEGAKNFFQRYWIYIIVLLIVISVTGYFAYKRFEKELLTKKIRKMKIEEKVLDGLMKKTQTERFKENKISGLVYNIRIKKYQERLQEIKEELPVFEERLEKMRKHLKTKKPQQGN
jgi:preprotein translocase subunit SecG